jgi:hypothetical protein
MFTSSFLDSVRRRAVRGRVWFRALDGLERDILSLSARVLDGVVDVSCLGVKLTKRARMVGRAGLEPATSAV